VTTTPTWREGADRRTMRMALRGGSSDGNDRGVTWLSTAGTSESWRGDVDAYFEHVSALGHQLLKLIARSLGLATHTYFDPFFDRALELMNFNYYHATKSSLAEGKLGCGSHTDYGMLTILMTDQVPGLQVCRDKTRAEGEREWIDVRPMQDMWIVNTGDMLERWTNGRYISNLHRVCNAEGKERLSVAFFFEPNVDALVAPLQTVFKDQEGPKEYDSVVYGDWLAQKYKSTGEVL